MPVYEGFSMPNAIQRIDVAGRDVTEALQTQLRKSGYLLQTSGEKEIVRMIKEKCCYVAAHPAREEKDLKEYDEFRLPDGNAVKVGFRCCRTRYIASFSSWRGRGIEVNQSGLTPFLFASLFSFCSSVRNGSERPRSSSIPSYAGSSARECTRSSWTPLTASTWTCGGICTPTWC